MARRSRRPDNDAARVTKQLTEWRGVHEMDSAQYGWPHDAPLSIWNASIAAIASEFTPNDPAVTMDKIKTVITHVALGDVVEPEEMALCGSPRHIKLLDETIIPGIIGFVNKRPEYRPQRTEAMTQQGPVA